MKKLFACALCLAFLNACNNAGVKGFWDNVPLLEQDISVSENRLADFAELAVKAPEQEALEEMDNLFDRLKEDEVAYYVYSEWMTGAFYSILSPCRNATLYSKAVERIVSDGVFSQDETDLFIKNREWISYNNKGDKAIVPSVSLNGERTLVLVLDLSCPSCREALEKLSSKQLRKVAICLGIGSAPKTPNWDYYAPENGDAVFDIHMTPFYFIVSPQGTVEQTYTIAL